jgi:hypothetical protein
MRTLTTLQSIEMQRKTGAEPVLLIVVELGGTYGNINFSDKIVTYGSVSYIGKILDVSDLHSEEKISGIGTIESLTVTVDDSDELFRASMNRVRWCGKVVKVYHYFVGSEPLLILTGKVSTPFEWDDGNHKLKFDILTNNTQQEVSCVIEDVAGVNPDVKGKNVPIIFGTVVDLEVPMGIKPITGKLLDAISVVDVSTQPVISGSFEVENGDAFPQNTLITIIIGDHRLKGTFSGTTFTVSDFVRDSINFIRILTDNKGRMVKLVSTYLAKNLVGKQIILKQPYTASVSTTESSTSDQYYLVLAQKSFIDQGVRYLELTVDRPITQAAFDASISGTLVYPPLPNSEISIKPYFSILQPGTPVFIDGQSTEVFLINCGTGLDEVLSVKAYKNVQVKQGVKKKFLVEVPEEYYTIIDPYTLGIDNDLVAITFAKPLSTIDENWEDNIYVSLRSNVGPNIADILKWIIDNYTDCTVDSNTFSTYKIDIDKYPANFALTDSKEAFTVLAEIAYQARSSLFLRNGIITFHYLSKEPTATKSISDIDNIEKEMIMEYSPVEDIFTHLFTKWKENYSPETKEKTTNFKNNVSVFGYKKEELDIYIFRTESLIQKTLNFWGYRKSNQWLKSRITCFLTAVDIEIYDCVQFNMGLVTSKGIVYNLSHNSNDFEIHVDAWFPIIAGTATQSEFAWLTDIADIKPLDPTVTKGTVPEINVIATTTPIDSGSGAPPVILAQATGTLDPSGIGTFDLYENGFENAPTRTNIVAEDLGGNTFSEGDKVALYQNGAKYYTQKGGGLSKLNVGSTNPTAVTDGADPELASTLNKFMKVVNKDGTPVLGLSFDDIYVTDGTNAFKLSDLIRLDATGVYLKSAVPMSDGTTKGPLQTQASGGNYYAKGVILT